MSCYLKQGEKKGGSADVLISSCSLKPFEIHRLGLRLGEADSVLAEVVHGKVLAKEGVADDPDRAHRSRDVQTGEGGDAAALNVEDVVRGLDGILLAVKGESEGGKLLDTFARNRHF